jgi:hypothetical protein
VVERFVLGARPPMDPDKSENRLRKALRKADDAAVVRPAEAPAEAPADGEHKRGLFGRRR